MRAKNGFLFGLAILLALLYAWGSIYPISNSLHAGHALLALLVFGAITGIRETPLGFQSVSTALGMVVMERLNEGPIFVIPIIGRLYLYPTGEIQITIQSPPKARVGKGLFEEKDYVALPEIEFDPESPSNIMMHVPYRINFVDQAAAVASIIEDRENKRVEYGGQPYTEDERRNLEKILNKMFPAGHFLNKDLTADPKVTWRGYIRSPAQFKRWVGDLHDLARNIRTITRNALQTKAGRRTLGMAKVTQPEFEMEMWIAIHEAIVDPDSEAWRDPEKRRKTWGVDGTAVVIEDWGIPYSVNIAMAKEAAAEPSAKAREIEGRGDATYELQRLKALADGRQAMLEAEAKGMLAEIQLVRYETGRFLMRNNMLREYARGIANVKALSLGGSGGPGDIMQGLLSAAEVLDNKGDLPVPKPPAETDSIKVVKTTPKPGPKPQKGGGQRQKRN